MATTPISTSLNRGGSFLVASITPDEIFTPADLSDDQRLIGQTAEEFVTKEVVPLIPELEQHKEGLMAELLKKAGEVGLLGGAIPEEYGGAGLDKVSATVLAEKLAVYASFAVSHGGHAGIGTIPIVYFGTEAQKKKYLPKIASGEWLSCYCLSEPQAGSDALASRTRAVLSPDGKKLASERAEDVDHERRIRRRLHCVRESGRREIFVLHRGARHAGIHRRRRRKEDGHPGQFDGAAIFRERGDTEGKSAARNRARAHRGVQHAECGAIFAWARIAWAARRKCWRFRRSMRRSGRLSAKRISEFGLIKAKLGEMAIRTYAVESMIYRSAGMIEAAVAIPTSGARQNPAGDAGAGGIRDRKLDQQSGGKRDAGLLRGRSGADFRRLRFSRGLSGGARVPRQPREPDFRRHERNQSHAHHPDADETRDGAACCR